MKKLIFIPVLSLSIAATLLTSCGKDKPLTSETNTVETASTGDLYAVDTANSEIEWKGFKVFKSENTSHFGTIRFADGEVSVKDGKLESGKFTANMKSLENVNLKDEPAMKSKLEEHLKSGDFFEVEKYPTAKFEISRITPEQNGDYNTLLDGNLTIKGITKPVQLKANVTVTGNQVSIATEPADINREDFGVKFQAPAENGILKNEVEIQVLIKANKK